ncbi:hypothetical protein ACTEV4_002608 [Cronobacter turicensis]
MPINFDIFLEVSGFTFNSKTFEKIMLGNNKLASCLTTHLAIERFLEAWICSFVGMKDLFVNDSKDKSRVRFSMNFMSKAKMAQRMGLPLAAYRIIEKLNNIRNNFAHQHDYEGATHREFIEIIESIDKLPSYGHKALGDEDYMVFIDDGKSQQKHQLSSESCPHELRYAAITYGLLIRCMLYMVNELPIIRSTNYAVADGYKCSSITFKNSAI